MSTTVIGGDDRNFQNTQMELERLRAQVANLSNLNRNLTENLEKERRNAFIAQNESRTKVEKAEAFATALDGMLRAFNKGARL